MKKQLLFVFVTITSCVLTIASVPKSVQSLSFIENKGQFVNDMGSTANNVLFRAQAPGTDIFITTSGITYMFTKSESDAVEYQSKTAIGRNNSFPSVRRNTSSTIYWNRLDMVLKNATIKKENVSAEEKQITYYNYYLGHCPEGITNVGSYRKIIIKNVYPGIDWHIYTKLNGSLKYDFIVHQGANASAIKMEYVGAEKINFLDNGNIQIKTDIGEINENNIYCYEEKTGKKIGSTFALNNNELSFNLGDYNRANTLVIDPDLVWGTYFGGSLKEIPTEIVSDAAGNTFAIGASESINIPTNNPGGTTYYQGTHNGGVGGALSGSILIPSEAFVAKFNTAGVLVWCTYYGATTGDEGFNSAAINSTGDIYIAGNYGHHDVVRPNPLIPHNFPLQNMAGAYFRNTVLGAMETEAVVLQFDNNGIRKWATFYGGSYTDHAYDICIDKNDNTYIVGRTQSTNIPTVNPGGGAHISPSQVDVFIAKFSPVNQLVWATYWGGSALGVHTVYCTTDQNNNFIIAGTTDSPDLPLLNPGGGAYYNNIVNPPVTVGMAMVMFDMFVAKFTSAGVPFWGTYYGGNGQDECYALCTDMQNNIYLTGYSGYTLPGNTPNTFQTFNPGGGSYYDPTWQGGGADLAILKFSPTGIRQWVTFYSGTTISDEIGGGITVDASGNIFVTGTTPSSTFPAIKTGCGFLQSANASTAITPYQDFIVQFSPALTVEWSTYYGGTGMRNGSSMDNSIAIDGLGNLFYISMYQGPACPLFNSGGGAYYQANNAGDFDAIIIKFSPAPDVIVSNDTTICSGQNVTLSASWNALSCSWGSGGSATNNVAPTTNTTYSVVATNNLCADTSFVTVTVLPKPVAVITGSNSICPGDNVQLTASGGTNYLWSTTSTNSTITVSPVTATSYTAVVYNGVCTDTASFTININSINAQINANATNICVGDSVHLNASGGANYLWSNFNSSPSIVVHPSTNTTYSLIASSGNCADTTTVYITVTPLPVPAISSDTAICEGSSIALAASGGTVYSWSNNSHNSFIFVSPLLTSVYTVTIANGNCRDEASVTVTVNPLPVANAGVDQTTNIGSAVTLNGTGGTVYVWTPSAGLSCNDCPNPTVSPATTTTYMLIVTNENGCTSTDEITVFVNDVLCGNIYVPTAFSPNNDGQNDVFMVKGTCFKTFHIDIFNRWGERIYSSDNFKQGWDGTYKGNDVNSDVFVYKLHAELQNGENFSKEGHITLLR